VKPQKAAAAGESAAHLIERVLTELRAQLAVRGSALASAQALDAGLEFQAREILAEALGALAAPLVDVPVISYDYADEAALLAHGEFSAARDVDPAEPLMAAEVLFGVALPELASHVGTPEGSRDLDVARALHHAIWRRFPPGAIAYVEVLRARLQASQAETRLRLSREIHDRIAHGIAAGIQRLDVSQSSDSNDEVDGAIRVLRATLMDAQDLAVDLRALVGDRELLDALEEYAYATGGGGILPIHVTQLGNPRPTPQLVREELFAIVLEATRNARQHARNATAINVRLSWSGDALELIVSDDGDGYSEEELRPGALGLKGIAERAGAVGAEAQFASTSGDAGLRVRLPFTVGQSFVAGLS
jgi:signal transduction histidine kinase